jgi:trimethylamine--corrinoid protein Co-methyltransferase
MEGGGKSAAERATGIWQEALKTYAEPPLDPGIREALAEFVARRKQEGGAPID